MADKKIQGACCEQGEQEVLSAIVRETWARAYNLLSTSGQKAEVAAAFGDVAIAYDALLKDGAEQRAALVALAERACTFISCQPYEPEWMEEFREAILAAKGAKP